MECSDKCPMWYAMDEDICPFKARQDECLYTAVHKFQMEREDEG